MLLLLLLLLLLLPPPPPPSIPCQYSYETKRGTALTAAMWF
jgi:hypothetical protein